MGALDELARPATDDDMVGGVPARLVAAPRTTAQAAALLAETPDLAVVIRGGGSKLDWGPPPDRLDLIIDTGRLTGVVEHAAGDLITVVRSGTPMSDLDLPGQQLALDSPLPGATVGGTVAANVSGPRRVLYGTTRDLLIGITVARADGTVARSGGKVVKNVAGYDLGKLFTGSYGTLGLITECAFRLHPLPETTAVVRAVTADPGRLVASVLAAQVVPAAVELDAPPGGLVEVAVQVEGTAQGVADRVARLGAEFTEGRPAWWGRFPWAPGEVGLKLTAPLSRVPELLAAAGADMHVRGSAGSGVLYAGIPSVPSTHSVPGIHGVPGARSVPDIHGVPGARSVPDIHGVPLERSSGTLWSSPAPAAIATAVERLRAAATRAGGHVVVLTAPAEVREIVDMWGPVGGLTLMRRVKDQFDPGHRLAPGRFVGGI